MTVASSSISVSYPGSPAATQLPAPFRVLDPADLVVTRKTVTGPVETLVLGIDYSVTLAPTAATVNLVNATTGGYTYTVTRRTARKQPDTLLTGGAFDGLVVEGMGDRGVLLAQELDAAKLDKPAVMTPLAPVVFNATGDGLQAGDPTGTGDMLLRGDLASVVAGKGGALVRFVHSIVGAAARTTTDRLRDWLSARDAGAAWDGATDDTAAVAAVITAAGSTGQVYLPQGDAVVTALNNTYGVPLRGPGRLLKAITGGFQQLNSEADDHQLVIGREYLGAFHKVMLNSQNAAAILLSGDSTTNGDTTTTPYRPWEILKILGQERGFEVTVANGGHSGKDTNDWVTSYLTADLATNPDLYVVRWGINDPFDGRTLAQFAASLRAGLAQIRAAKTVAQMSVLLMVPSSTSDTPNGRDEKWYEQVRRVYRQVAREYQCACFDTYAFLRDSRNGAAGFTMDNPFGDGRAIHPSNVMNAWIYSAVADVLFPQGVRPRMFGATIGNLVVGTAPNRYPYGASLFSSAAGASDFLVTNASVMTQRTADGAVYQRAWSNYDSGSNNGGYPMPQLMERLGLGTTWYTNITEPSLDLTSLLVNSWVPFVAGSNVPRAKKTNNQVTLSGLIKNGTVTAGTTLFTLPAGYRPRNTVEAFLCAMGPTGTTTPCVIHVANTGVVTLQSAGNAAFVSLSGISFEVGA